MSFPLFTILIVHEYKIVEGKFNSQFFIFTFIQNISWTEESNSIEKAEMTENV